MIVVHEAKWKINSINLHDVEFNAIDTNKGHMF